MSNFLEIAIVLIINIICFSLTMHFASPKKIYNFNQDVSKLRVIKNISNSVSDYFYNNQDLPDSLAKVEQAGYLKQYNIDLKEIGYKKINSNSFSLDINFLTSSKDFRRTLYSENQFVRYNNNVMPFEKGNFVFTYQLKRNPESYGEKVSVTVKIHAKH